MLDKVLKDPPVWLNSLYEMRLMETEQMLKKHSASFLEKQKLVGNMYQEYPYYGKILGGEDINSPITLTEKEQMDIAALLSAQDELADMRKKMLYLLGIRDGKELKKYEEILNDKDIGGKDDV